MSTKKVQIPVRLRPALKELLEKAAHASQMSQSEYAAKALEEKLERDKAEGRI
jgi:hypothetical protein